MRHGYRGHGPQRIADPGLITATRNAHIIVIFIKHRAYAPRFALARGSGRSNAITAISDETLVIANDRNRD
jgi:hypothetical protein